MKLYYAGLNKRAVDLPGESSNDDFAPKKYSGREHAIMGLKIFLIIGIFFGLLWLVDVRTRSIRRYRAREECIRTDRS